MVEIFTIRNPENNVKVEINEVIILNTIKALKYRHKELYKIWVDKLETLNQETFNEESLKY